MKDFINLVAKMRAAQTYYFKTHDKNWLTKSIALEKEVDKKLLEFNNPRLL